MRRFGEFSSIWILLAMMTLLGCGQTKFEKACRSIEQGMTMGEVWQLMEDVDAHYIGKLDEQHYWIYDGNWRPCPEGCHVQDDGEPNSHAPDPRDRAPDDNIVESVRFTPGRWFCI